MEGDMEDHDIDVPLGTDVMEAVEQEVSQSRLAVQQSEADAEKKGIPLELQGVRYRIYETTKPV
jgi:hypothetical protein